MASPVQVIFHNMNPYLAAEDVVRERAGKLERCDEDRGDKGPRAASVYAISKHHLVN